MQNPIHGTEEKKLTAGDVLAMAGVPLPRKMIRSAYFSNRIAVWRKRSADQEALAAVKLEMPKP